MMLRSNAPAGKTLKHINDGFPVPVSHKIGEDEKSVAV